MFCPSCSTSAPEGGKFCKSCGLNLSVISQALGGGAAALDPIREREYRRARKKISDGIQGSTVGASMIAAAAVAYFVLPRNGILYAISLVLGLAGIVTLFRSIGHILDAKIGPKLLEPGLQPRGGTGPLTGPLPALPQTSPATGSRRLPAELAGSPVPGSTPEPRKPSTLERSRPGYPMAGQGGGTRSVPRPTPEPSSRLKPEHEEDFISKLRN